MSTRAIKIEIALQNLDPTVPHRKVGKDGRLLDGVKVGTKPDGGAVVTTVVPVHVVSVETPVRNALVDLVLEEKHEDAPVAEDTTEDESKNLDDQTETPKKRGGFKKKAVSTDP